MVVLSMKQLLPKNISNSRLEFKNHTLFMTKMAKIDTLFRVPPPPPPGTEEN